MSIDLSNRELKAHIDAFHDLDYKPSLSVSDNSDVHIRFTKRKDKYYGIRTGKKIHFESRTEFLVNSFFIEEIRAHVKEKLVLENLSAVNCSSVELNNIYAKAEKIKKYLPSIRDIESSYSILNSSDLNWIFLEDENKYHSLFWNESETRFFSRCA